MEERTHALLSPSTSERWLNCTPSVYLESLEPDTPPSIYAAEGTEAHALGELKLSYMLSKISPELYDTKYKEFRSQSQFYNEEFNEFVNSYCQEVMTIIKEDYKDEQVEVYLEEKVEFNDIVPNGSGTSDVIIVGKNFIHIVDLKFGKGIPVSAIGNPQLRLYALGALKKFRLHGIFTEVRMTIIQPRLYDITTDFIAVMDLNDWAINFVKPRAELAIEGKGEIKSGPHCKFCKRKGKCEELSKYQLELAQKEFEATVNDDVILEPKDMTPETLSNIMNIGPKFVAWFNDVISYANAAILNGTLTVPGYKVVRGRATRVLTNPEAIQEKLRTAGFAEDDYLSPRQLLGITALEKNVGKRLFNELCKDYIVKPEGKLTVVPESDRRPAVGVKELGLYGQEFENYESEEKGE